MQKGQGCSFRNRFLLRVHGFSPFLCQCQPGQPHSADRNSSCRLRRISEMKAERKNSDSQVCREPPSICCLTHGFSLINLCAMAKTSKMIQRFQGSLFLEDLNSNKLSVKPKLSAEFQLSLILL